MVKASKQMFTFHCNSRKQVFVFCPRDQNDDTDDEAQKDGDDVEGEPAASEETTQSVGGHPPLVVYVFHNSLGPSGEIVQFAAGRASVHGVLKFLLHLRPNHVLRE